MNSKHAKDKNYQKYLRRVLSKPHEPIELITAVNKGLHYIVRTHTKEHYWCLIRWSGPFRMFGHFFLEGRRQPGESINRDQLVLALRLDATLLFSYPTTLGSFESFTISAKRFKELAEEGNFIRTTKSREETYSIPLTDLEALK